MHRVFLTPHPDDETLFGAFTLIRHHPTVICVLDCAEGRRMEFVNACRTIGVQYATWDYPEADPDWLAIRERIARLPADVLYAPAYHVDGNQAHNELAAAAQQTDAELVSYLTYTTEGKMTDGELVECHPSWIGVKLAAMCCYPSQYSDPRHAPHFLREQTEYYAW